MDPQIMHILVLSLPVNLSVALIYSRRVHSNFLINNGSASSMDIELLGEEIKATIKMKFNINLKWELVRIGEFKKI